MELTSGIYENVKTIENTGQTACGFSHEIRPRIRMTSPTREAHCVNSARWVSRRGLSGNWQSYFTFSGGARFWRALIPETTHYRAEKKKVGNHTGANQHIKWLRVKMTHNQIHQQKQGFLPTITAFYRRQSDMTQRSPWQSTLSARGFFSKC